MSNHNKEIQALHLLKSLTGNSNYYLARRSEDRKKSLSVTVYDEEGIEDFIHLSPYMHGGDLLKIVQSMMTILKHERRLRKNKSPIILD